MGSSAVCKRRAEVVPSEAGAPHPLVVQRVVARGRSYTGRRRG
jgi:hypothetical protein